MSVVKVGSMQWADHTQGEVVLHGAVGVTGHCPVRVSRSDVCKAAQPSPSLMRGTRTWNIHRGLRLTSRGDGSG